jgi:hypothetical protein
VQPLQLVPTANPYGSPITSDPALSEGKPPTYLVQAILCTLFCCWPFGIVAIVYAAQVDSKWFAGDSYGAVQASNNAKTWCWVSLSIMAVIYIFFVALALAAQRR